MVAQKKLERNMQKLYGCQLGKVTNFEYGNFDIEKFNFENGNFEFEFNFELDLAPHGVGWGCGV